MFIAYEVSLEVIRLLRPVLPLIARHDPDLADQLRRASNAAPLHIAEGRRLGGREPRQYYRRASGTSGEGMAALDVAIAAGYVDEPVVAAARATIDRLLGLLYPLAR